MTIKTAILLEWLHLFCPTGARNRFWWTAHVLLYANIVFYCAAILALHLSCVPHARIVSNSRCSHLTHSHEHRFSGMGLS